MPALALRGHVGAAYNLLPNDPTLLACSREQLLFADHYKKLQLDMMFDRLSKLLGVKYTTKDLRDLLKTAGGTPQRRGKKEQPTEVMFPLALLLNPQVFDVLKNTARNMSLRSSDKSDLSGLDYRTYKEVMRTAIEDAARSFSQDVSTPEPANA